MQLFDYIFNVGGNYTATINGMTEATGDFSAKVESANNWVGKLSSTLAVVDLARNAFEQIDSAVKTFNASGITLDSQMHDLSAVAGVVGEDLKKIEGYARESAKAFGTDAGVAVEGYKLLLSQLSPELGKFPEALQAMGNSIQVTSKLMGNDGVAAAEVLTTAMNQYGVSLDDPMEASRKMAEMMNVMAAAGQEGSAELPAIKVALEQCGMAAKAANVSFEETNAAIQVLDKAGKKGSEGGVALRNTLAILGQGRFLPKQTQEELAAAGIDVLKLADTSLSLKDRLDMLKPVLNDAALFSKLFGMENANAARALVQGSDELGRLTTAITGTASAEEQAAIVMDSYAERQARINQKIEDFKISLFQMTGDFGIWVGAAMGILTPLAQITPLLLGMGQMMSWIKGLQWASMWSSIKGFLYACRIQMMMMNRELVTGQFASNGFLINITRATLAVVRFATVGILQALKGLGAFVLSLVTGGATSATFAGIASASFATFKTAAVTACRAVGVAIKSIPVIGWIIAAISAIAALFAYFWDTSAKFRGVIKGIGAFFVAIFKGMWEVAKEVLGGIASAIWKCVTFQWDEVGDELSRIGNAFSNYGKQAASAFNDAYQAEVNKENAPAESAETKIAEVQALDGAVVVPPPTPTPDPTAGTLGSVGTQSAASSDKIKNVSVNIEKLVERFEIHTTNLQGDISRVKDMVSEALLSALNDVNLAI
ncbi:MAG: phage tail tape measure protein [Clostridia bacterium]|nr:phage tail tape measure protein [Clostridia bacterium]